MLLGHDYKYQVRFWGYDEVTPPSAASKLAGLADWVLASLVSAASTTFYSASICSDRLWNSLMMASSFCSDEVSYIPRMSMIPELESSDSWSESSNLLGPGSSVSQSSSSASSCAEFSYSKSNSSSGDEDTFDFRPPLDSKQYRCQPHLDAFARSTMDHISLCFDFDFHLLELKKLAKCAILVSDLLCFGGSSELC